jgi:aminopeptidase
MTDPRIQKLADVLVNYSVKVQPGDWVSVVSHKLAEPLAIEVLRAALQAGGHPTLNLDSESIGDTLVRYGSEEQLSWISPLEELVVNQADVMIGIMASENTRYMSQADPHKQTLRQQAWGKLMEIHMRRAAEGSLRWTFTQYPCQAYAQDAEMSLREYQDFVHHATFTDQEDPVAAWQKVHDDQQKVIDYLKGKKQVTVKSPNADLSLSIEGRTFINSDGDKNMPSGEVFTGPVEDSVNGWVHFTYPAIYEGREVTGLKLEFKNGRVEKASAEKNQDFLLAMLDLDEGSRYLGEFAIGTNYGIQKFTGSILYDEKIGGSFHVALGAGYPEPGSQNNSQIHWDLICDVKEDSEIRVDGELLYKNGQFVI